MAMSPRTRVVTQDIRAADLASLNARITAAGTATPSGTTEPSGPAGTRRLFRWLTGTVARWELTANATAESGSDAGSDLELITHDDAGTVKDMIFQIIRSTGITTWYKPIYVQAVLRAYGGLANAYATKSGAYTLTTTDHTINCTAAVTITVPAASTFGSGRQFTIKNSTGSSTVTVTAASGTIDGATNKTLNASQALTIEGDGSSAWVVLSAGDGTDSSLRTLLANTNLTYAAASALATRPSVPTGLSIRIYGGASTDSDPTWMVDGDYRDLYA